MKKIVENQALKSQTTLEGTMTFAKTNNGLNALDFACCEDVMMNPFVAHCKVQAMRDGNVYITELPKRVKNHPLFRDDNCALTLGRDGRYYFVFSLPEQLVDELPYELRRQADAIAEKVEDTILYGKEELV